MYEYKYPKHRITSASTRQKRADREARNDALASLPNCEPGWGQPYPGLVFRDMTCLICYREFGIQAWARRMPNSGEIEIFDSIDAENCIGNADDMAGARQFARELLQSMMEN